MPTPKVRVPKPKKGGGESGQGSGLGSLINDSLRNKPLMKYQTVTGGIEGFEHDVLDSFRRAGRKLYKTSSNVRSFVEGLPGWAKSEVKTAFGAKGGDATTRKGIGLLTNPFVPEMLHGGRIYNFARALHNSQTGRDAYDLEGTKWNPLGTPEEQREDSDLLGRAKDLWGFAKPHIRENIPGGGLIDQF